ncbi:MULTISPECIES: c-type cytochrome biogenesis protein CcsB [Bacillaceae]|uniref:C-type cytochrome biogenesis protein CcsB n=1 Tax=Halalkalibacter alkaliphilus TaxID=2917993 RepID=A0A9X2A0W9_9BACI|nr:MULTISPECIES: c-type cytochrome biogenesis protein CcsB [Bacillaceae]MCL7746665.1 c-type cytochrome biogenesis protein CcsB [Halalkalibacter alkaliphilus]MDT8860497.1 c-type cytochrome biogenesis protein CcsB [Alkalihalobacillus sp. MEB130]
MVELSSNLLLAAFFIYIFATIAFSITIYYENSKSVNKTKRWGWISFGLACAGFLAQLGYFVTRWIAAGHAPVSNMFEYTTFLGLTIIFAFLILYLIYKKPVLGIFSMPVGIVIIAYASVFPSEVTPLIPALQTYWLHIHVITTAIGQGILGVGFIAGLIYLIRVVDQSKRSKQTFWLEAVIYSVTCAVAIAITVGVFSLNNYSVTFNWINEWEMEAQLEYELPAIVGPYEGELITADQNRFGPLLETPSWMNGVESPRKLNTFFWSILSGSILYLLLRFILRRRIAAAIQPILKNVSPQLFDEVSYRSIIIGFPVFTLGGLIFAMIWAQIAWTRFWGWDPKEVWALITFLFYAAYLHLRLSRGWHGEKSAWLLVIGFGIIMFNLLFINLVIAGLHSYA